MENAVDALKIAFAVLAFVIALTVAMVAFGQARTASETVFYMTDKTNFYEHVEDDEISKRYKEGRIVSGETIIPTLYRYYKENFNIVVLDSNNKKVAVYNLEEENQIHDKDNSKAPWMGSANVDAKKRIDIDLSGKEGIINGFKYKPQMVSNASDGTNMSLLEYLNSHQFIEYFLEQQYSGKTVTSADDVSLELVKGNTKIWIIYKEYR